MSDYKNIEIQNFNYDLPEESIAKFPVVNRGQSKLLIWRQGIIEEDNFNNITGYLPENSLMVFNNTKVIHARILFKKPSGATIELFCLDPVEPEEHQQAFTAQGRTVWKCMVGNSKKWKSGVLEKKLRLKGTAITLCAGKVSYYDNTQIIEFTWNGEFTFSEIISKAGILPIPPYLKRETEPSDEDNYQTVYAKLDGSVAAPTAGLHFTQNILDELPRKNINLCEITLHVGAGTFQPVKSAKIDGHKMHTEKVLIGKKVIEELLYNYNKIIAVGTTSVRSIESLYWLGLHPETKLHRSKNLHVSQWEPYETNLAADVKKSLENILLYLDKTGQDILHFSTDIIIVPGYEFKLTKGIITNFHLPKSTLLLLISAFTGDHWKQIYNFALSRGFRFLSYGDSNLYLKEFNK